jgi:hypothetical protein
MEGIMVAEIADEIKGGNRGTKGSQRKQSSRLWKRLEDLLRNA